LKDTYQQEELNQRGFPLTGLQFICNDLNHTNTNDIYVSGGEIRYMQGTLNSGADNYFTHPYIGYNFYLHAQHTPIIYYYSPGMEPINRTNNVALLPASKNSCSNTLCNDVIIIELKDAGSGAKLLHSSLEEYRELNHKLAEMMRVFYAKGYDKVLNDYFSGHIENEDLLKAAMTYHEEILAVTEYMATISNAALYHLKTDSLIDLTQIRDWYNEIYTLSAKYSLAETYEQLGQFEEGLNTLIRIPEMFNLNEYEMIEHNNYVSLFIFKNKIRESGRTIAQLDEAEIEQMIHFAKVSRGLSSVLAQGILCFFYDICFENKDDETQKTESEKNLSVLRSSGLTVSESDKLLENITIYPNPTTGELIIVSVDVKIDKIEVLDFIGKVVSSHPLINNSTYQKINISHLDSGIYFIKISTDTGEAVRKVVKQ
jgi:hypothetical protein